jgi:hypothetical protein
MADYRIKSGDSRRSLCMDLNALMLPASSMVSEAEVWLANHRIRHHLFGLSQPTRRNVAAVLR